jgi:hypothetical protein
MCHECECAAFANDAALSIGGVVTEGCGEMEIHRDHRILAAKNK